MTAFALPQLHRTGRQPHYESFYLRANRPGGDAAFWIRYTLLRRVDGTTTASIWLTYFDRERETPLAFKQTFPETELILEQNAQLLEIAGSAINYARAEGQVDCEAGKADWSLHFGDGPPPFHYLPRARLYQWPVPRTKFISAHPQTNFSGELEVDGERIEINGWHGMMGHNWGTEHAQRWVWMNCNEFEGEDSDTYFDGGGGRTRVGSWTTPWLCSGLAVVRGQRYRFNRLSQIVRGQVFETHTACELLLTGLEADLKVRVSAPAERFVGYEYADPTGEIHHTLNCSLADAELELQPRHGEPITLTSHGGASYEIGVAERDHGIKMMPFKD